MFIKLFFLLSNLFEIKKEKKACIFFIEDSAPSPMKVIYLNKLYDLMLIDNSVISFMH